MLATFSRNLLLTGTILLGASFAYAESASDAAVNGATGGSSEKSMGNSGAHGSTGGSNKMGSGDAVSGATGGSSEKSENTASGARGAMRHNNNSVEPKGNTTGNAASGAVGGSSEQSDATSESTGATSGKHSEKKPAH